MKVCWTHHHHYLFFILIYYYFYANYYINIIIITIFAIGFSIMYPTTYMTRKNQACVSSTTMFVLCLIVCKHSKYRSTNQVLYHVDIPKFPLPSLLSSTFPFSY